MDREELTELLTRYAEAWSSRNPAALASFFAEDGSLTINDGEPSVGREAIERTAREFMEAFPDMVVRLVELREEGDRVVFGWHWTGTHSGPGGTGNSVDLRGHELLTLERDGLIAEALGHFDEREYRRQLEAGAGDEEAV